MFVALRDLRFAKGRFALMGTVVVLVTLLVTLLSGLTAGLGKENTSAITGLNADHLVFQQPPKDEDISFADSRLPADTASRFAALDGVESASPLGITTTRATAGTATAAVSAFGVGEGLGPQGVADGDVVLSESAAEDLAAKAGEEVTLGGTPLRVAAVEGEADYSHTPVIWTSIDDWRALAGSDGSGSTVVALRTDDDDLAHADGDFGTTTVARENSLSAIGSYSSENGSLQLMRGFLFVISALVIAAFFTVWTIQRSGDVAVLKALGASTGYLLRDAIGQALTVLILGTALGTGIGVGLGALATGTVPFVLDPSTTLLPAVVMVVLGVAGAALAIRRITSVDPLTALGSTR